MASILAPVVAREFINRDEERLFLSDRWKAALRSQGSLVLIEGEAGAGKSRLVENFRAGSPDGLSLTGRCLPYASASFAPIADVLSAAFAAYPVAAPPAAHLRSTLRSIVPEIGPPYDILPADESLVVRWMYEAIAQTFNRLSAATPAIVLIEDLHWADRATLNTLLHLGSMLGDLRIVVLATYRHDEDRPDPLGAFLADAGRLSNTGRIRLQPLKNEDSRRVLASALPPSAVIGSGMTSRIVKLAGGNPLFLEELLKHLLERGAPDDTRTLLPSSVDHAVGQRLFEFADDERRSVEIASVIGRHFTASDVAEIGSLDSELVRQALGKAREANLLIGGVRSNDAFSFRHDLLRAAVYAHMEGGTRRGAHRLVAERLERTADSEEHLADLAHHWSQAGDYLKALAYSERSGDRASAVFAHADAADHYERAIRLAERLGVASASLYQRAGEAHMRAGAFEEALAFLERAQRSTGLDRETQVALLRDLGYIAARNGDIGGNERYLQTALELTRSPELEGRFVEIAIDLAAMACVRNRFGEAASYIEQARPHSGLRPERFRFIDSYFAYGIGDLERWRASVESVLERPLVAQDYGIGFALLHNAAQQALELGDYAFAQRLASVCCESAVGFDMTSDDERAKLVLAEASLETGDFETAGRLLAGPHRSNRLAEMEAAVLRLWLAFAQQRSAGDDAARVLEFLRAGGFDHPVAFCALAGACALAPPQSRPPDIDKLLFDAITAIEDTSGTLRTLLAAAMTSADEDLLALSRAKLTQTAKQRPNPRIQMVLCLFDALAARTAGKAQTEALVAAERARAMGAGLFALLADRILSPVKRESKTPAGTDSLSARQRAIARLVATGKTNGEIALELSISQRTVETHVSTVLRKLGLRSRTELALAMSAADR